MASDTQSDSMKSSKKQPEPKKVLDVSRPKRRPAAAGPATAPQLVIPKRSVMVTVADSPSTSSDPVDAATPGQTTSAPAAPKRTARIIEPSTAPEVKSADGDTIRVAKAVVADSQKPSNTSAETIASEPETPRPTPAPEEPKKEDAPTPPKASNEDTSEAEPTSPDATSDSSEEQEADPTDADAKPNDADVRKALEDAKREEQIRGYIDKHEFFVPINSVARKRNIKVTLMLVALELILGLFLLNLMLDAGLIYLLQKIPHTHFFDLQ
jgi:hypothetical protein